VSHSNLWSNWCTRKCDSPFYQSASYGARLFSDHLISHSSISVSNLLILEYILPTRLSIHCHIRWICKLARITTVQNLYILRRVASCVYVSWRASASSLCHYSCLRPTSHNFRMLFVIVSVLCPRPHADSIVFGWVCMFKCVCVCSVFGYLFNTTPSAVIM